MRRNHPQILSCLLLLFFLAVLTPAEGAAAAVEVQTASEHRVYLPIVIKPHTLPLPAEPGYCLTPAEVRLAAITNQLRRENGLPDAPLSRSLSMVAQAHVNDLQVNNPNRGTDARGLSCNMHSWSDRGYWEPVCYTSDHYYASGMWRKPDEITRGVYKSSGFEIAAWTSNDITPERALGLWRNSAGHLAVILEQNAWAGSSWPAMGIGISNNYAVIWFGKAADPMGTIAACQP